jgi:hypothetical protein
VSVVHHDTDNVLDPQGKKKTRVGEVVITNCVSTDTTWASREIVVLIYEGLAAGHSSFRTAAVKPI